MTVDHKAIREALEEATPGPWQLWIASGMLAHDVFDEIAWPNGNSIVWRLQADAELAANAPEWLRQLLDENQALHEEKKLILERLENGGMRAEGEPAMLFYKMVVELFEQNGGKNFLTLTVEKPDKSKRYSITVQNLNGELSPAEKMEAQAKEIERLQNVATEIKKRSDESAQIHWDTLKRAQKAEADKAAAVEALKSLPDKIMQIDRFADTEELTFPLINPTEDEQNEWFDTFISRMDEYVKGVVEDELTTLQRIESGDKE